MHARSRVEILDIGNFPIIFADKEQGNYSKTLVGEKGSLQVRGRVNLAIGANGVAMRAYDDANIFISRNALGSVTLSGSSMETVMYDTATHRLQDISVAYIDESSKSLKSKIHIGKNATLITPDYFSGVPMLLETSGDDKAKIPLRHFKLPPGLNSIKDLVTAGGELNVVEIKKLNGTSSSDNKSVSLTARDSEDRKVTVTFELRQVPNEEGRLVSGLVMTKISEVASTVSAPAPTPPVPVVQTNPIAPPQSRSPATQVKVAPLEITAPVESRKLVVSSAFGFREPLLKSNGEKSQDRYILAGSWGGVIDGAGGQERGDIAAQALQEVLQSIVEGKDHTFTHNGENHLVRANRLDFEGKNRTDNANDLLFLATHLNTRLQKVNEAQSVKSMAAIAIGKIYLDQNKERTFTYLNHGDCEIAIVKKNGTVELLHNSSVRIGAEKEDNGIEYYLKEREASRRLLTGSGSNEFLKSSKWSYGSISLD